MPNVPATRDFVRTPQDRAQGFHDFGFSLDPDRSNTLPSAPRIAEGSSDHPPSTQSNLPLGAEGAMSSLSSTGPYWDMIKYFTLEDARPSIATSAFEAYIASLFPPSSRPNIVQPYTSVSNMGMDLDPQSFIQLPGREPSPLDLNSIFTTLDEDGERTPRGSEPLRSHPPCSGPITHHWLLISLEEALRRFARELQTRQDLEDELRQIALYAKQKLEQYGQGMNPGGKSKLSSLYAR